MPTITRWFHVSHDINGDPEMWELRDKFSDRAAFVWLECLSIADRNSGKIGQNGEYLFKILASKCRLRSNKVATILQHCCNKGWTKLDDSGCLHVAKWLKYNRTRVADKFPSYPNLSSPILTNKKKKPKKASSLVPPPLEAVQCAQLLSDRLFENFPTRTAPSEAVLMAWAREAEKCHRIDCHSWKEIRELIDWAQNDAFWKANILSMGKLREKWNQLTAKMGGQSGQNSRYSAAEPKGFAGFREWAKSKGLKP